MKPLVVLRPAARAAATLARIAAAGGETTNMPLFAIEPLAWSAPDPAGFDAIALTSANAAAFAGDAIAALGALPVWAVGAATAEAARRAGFDVVHSGAGDAAALFGAMAAAGVRRALWLAGETRRPAPSEPAVTIIPTYRAAPLPIEAAALAGAVVLVHSPRAAATLATMVAPADRAGIHIAAISPAAAEAAGCGWASVSAAPRPDDSALVATAIDRARAHADKRTR